MRVQACGVCHTDLHYREGAINDDFPFLLGHEAAGVVEKIGDGVTNVRPGDFVSVRIMEPPIARAVRLPASAVDAAGKVLAVGEGDRLEVADVQVLRSESDDVIVRAPGLAGREIVAERTPLLGAGIRIRPVRPGGGQPAVEEPDLLALDPERRARLVSFVENNQFMPDAAKQRVLTALKKDKVPARMVERIESRMGG